MKGVKDKKEKEQTENEKVKKTSHRLGQTWRAELNL